MVVRTGANEDLELRVHRSEGLEEVTHLLLGHRVRQVQFLLVEVLGGYIAIEVIHRGDPYPIQHLPDIFSRMGKIAESRHYFSMNLA